jgi:hypothetical protein
VVSVGLHSSQKNAATRCTGATRRAAHSAPACDQGQATWNEVTSAGWPGALSAARPGRGREAPPSGSDSFLSSTCIAPRVFLGAANRSAPSVRPFDFLPAVTLGSSRAPAQVARRAEVLNCWKSLNLKGIPRLSAKWFRKWMGMAPPLLAHDPPAAKRRVRTSRCAALCERGSHLAAIETPLNMPAHHASRRAS